MSIQKQAVLTFKEIDQSTKTRHIFKSVQNINDQRAIDVYPVTFHYLGRDQLSKNGHPTNAENAIFYASHIYAVSDQVYKNLKDDVELVPFFKALALSDPTNTTLAKRVQLSFKSMNFESIILSLSQFQRMMHNHTHPLIDYGQLAQDLYSMQFNYDSYFNVIRKWSQDFFANTQTAPEDLTKDQA